MPGQSISETVGLQLRLWRRDDDVVHVSYLIRASLT